MTEPMTDERLDSEDYLRAIDVITCNASDQLDEIDRLRLALSRYIGEVEAERDRLREDNERLLKSYDHQWKEACAKLAKQEDESERLEAWTEKRFKWYRDENARARELLEECNLRLPNIDDLKGRVRAFLDGEENGETGENK